MFLFFIVIVNSRISSEFLAIDLGRGGSSLPMLNFNLSAFSLTIKALECLLRMFSIYGLVLREAQVILLTYRGMISFCSEIVR